MNKKIVWLLLTITLVALTPSVLYGRDTVDKKNRYVTHKAASWWFRQPSAYYGYGIYEFPYQPPMDSRNKTFWHFTNKTNFIITVYSSDKATTIYPYASGKVQHQKSFTFTITTKRHSPIIYTTSDHSITLKQKKQNNTQLYIVTKS